MATTMTNDTIQPVGFGGAFVRQLRFLWASRRPLLLAVALLAILVIAGDPWADDPKMRLLTVWPVWLVFIGPFWAFAVFHNEGPSNRFYFWSQPVSRTGHSLARIVAGLAWLWAIFALLILAGWVIGLVDGDAWQLGEIGLAGWVNFFTGPLIGYLAISLLTVPSDYPIRWFFGIILLFPFLVSLFVEWLEMEAWAEKLLEPLGNQDWGLGVTMIGGLGKDVVRLDDMLRATADPAYARSSGFEAAGSWWTATPLWILLFAVIVVFIATRHPDTLPKWRGLRR